MNHNLNPKNHDITDPQIKKNLEALDKVLSEIEKRSGLKLTINSGYRTREEQMKINPKAPNSMHTKGAAADVSDRTGDLWRWLTAYAKDSKVDTSNAVALDIYLENRTHTPTWVHIQTFPPKSKNRIFNP